MLKLVTYLKQKYDERKDPLTAEYAYTLKRYNKKLTAEQVFRQALEEINDRIKGSYSSCILFEYDNTYSEMKQKLIDYYENLGFYVLHIDVNDSIKQPKLLIVWER